jgi:hypothetical protein
MGSAAAEAKGNAFFLPKIGQLSYESFGRIHPCLASWWIPSEWRDGLQLTLVISNLTNKGKA